MASGAMSAGEAVVERWRLPWGWEVWPRWVLACAVGGAMAAGLAALAGWVGLALFGLAVALPQWLVPRRHLPGGWRWVPLTAVGVLAAGFVAFFAAYFAFFGTGFLLIAVETSLLGRGASHFDMAWMGIATWGSAVLLGGAVAGLVLGAVQLLMVRGLGAAATRWLVANLLGGALVGYPTVFVLQVALNQGLLAGDSYPPPTLVRVLATILAMALGGATYGLVTGSVLTQVAPDMDQAG